MRGRALVLLLFAVVAAGGTAYLARGWLNAQRSVSQPETVQRPRPAKTFVLVAASQLGAGSFIRQNHLAWQPWPNSNVPDSYIVRERDEDPKFDPYLGVVARVRILAGEPILPAQIVKPGERGFLSAVLDPGMRAVTVNVDRATGGSGLVFPGDYVDLMLTHEVSVRTFDISQNKFRNIKQLASETMLAGVRVVALDQFTDVQDGQQVIAKTATLELTPKQAELVTVGNRVGKLSLILRSLAPGEEEVAGADEEGFILVNALNGEDAAAREPSYTWAGDASYLMPSPNRRRPPARVEQPAPTVRPPASTARQKVKVVIYRGRNAQTMRVRSDGSLEPDVPEVVAPPPIPDAPATANEAAPPAAPTADAGSEEFVDDLYQDEFFDEDYGYEGEDEAGASTEDDDLALYDGVDRESVEQASFSGEERS